MKPDIKKRWIEALRSGEYKQGKQQLKIVSSDPPCYCCLGVLTDLAVKDGICAWWDDEGGTDYESGIYRADGTPYVDPYREQLPNCVVTWANLDDEAPRLLPSMNPDESYEYLSGINDEFGFSFDRIANLIEEQL